MVDEIQQHGFILDLAIRTEKSSPLSLRLQRSSGSILRGARRPSVLPCSLA